MASAGWTPRRRATSATDGLGGSPLLVDPDAVEVGRTGLSADSRPPLVVGVHRGVDERSAQLGVAQDLELSVHRRASAARARPEGGRTAAWS